MIIIIIISIAPIEVFWKNIFIPGSQIDNRLIIKNNLSFVFIFLLTKDLYEDLRSLTICFPMILKRYVYNSRSPRGSVD